jgi:chromosome segregation ATPase
MDIKGLFWKPDKKSPTNEDKPTQVQAPPQSEHSAPGIPQVSTEDFNMFYQQLYEALDAANMPGQDYMDLRQALKNMSNLSMTEETKFQAIFATMATAGADSESFIQSFDYYKNILSSEKQKFDEAIESAITDLVHTKQATLEQLTDTNTKNAAEIKRLTEEISANNTQITALQIEISNASSKLEQKKQNFESAYQKVGKEIDEDCVKSQKYIKILPTAPTQPTKISTRKSVRKEK